MSINRIQEGARQLYLGYLCENCAILLESSGANPQGGQLATDLRRRVFEPLLSIELLPSAGKYAKMMPASKIFGGRSDWRIDAYFPQQLRENMQRQVAVRDSAGGHRSDENTVLGDALKHSVSEMQNNQTPTESGIPQSDVGEIRVFEIEDPLPLWKKQAQAIVAWSDLQDELKEVTDNLRAASRRDGVLPILDQVRAAMRSPNQMAWSILSLCEDELPTFGDEEFSTDEIGDELDKCRQRIAEVGYPVGNSPRSTIELCRVIKLIEKSLDLSGHPSWPPLLIARLDEELRATKSAIPVSDVLLGSKGNRPEIMAQLRASVRYSLNGLSREAHENVVLILAMLGNFDQHISKMPDEAWKSLTSFVEDLLRSHDLTPRLLRGDESLREDWYETVVQPGLSGRQEFLKVGLTVGSSKLGTQVLRKASVAVRPEQPPVIAHLRELVYWLDRKSQSRHHLASVCEKFASRLEPYASLDDWWRVTQSTNRIIEEGERLWLLMQLLLGLLSSEKEAPVMPILKELASGGFQAEAVHEGDLTAAEPHGPMLIIPSEVERPQSARRNDPDLPKIALRLPDHSLIAPSVCILVPCQWSTSRPLVRYLVEAEPLLLGLKQTDPDWSGWVEFNQSLWKLAYVHEDEADIKVDAKLTFQAFKAVFLQSEQAPDAARSGYRSLAALFYTCITKDYRGRIVPEFETQRDFKPCRMTGPNQQLDVTWVKDESVPFGTIVQVLKLSANKRPGKVRVSLGTDVSAQITESLSLSDPTSAFALTDVGAPTELTALYQSIQNAPWNDREFKQRLEGHGRDFVRWLRTSVGGSWLNEVVHFLLAQSDEETTKALLWYRWLQDHQMLECFPEVDFDTSKISWPEHSLLESENIDWVPSETVPRRAPLDEVAQLVFAATPMGARGRFSIGPPQPGSPLDQAELMLQAANAAQWAPASLRDAVHALHSETRLASLSGREINNADLYLEPVLDHLADAIVRQSLSERQELWEVVLAWAGALDIEVTPRKWSFIHELSTGDLTANEGPQQAPKFTPNTRPGQVSLIRFGWEGPRPRSCQVMVSAGQAPVNYVRLTELLEQHQVLEALREQIGRWPAANMEGHLEHDVIKFYETFWEQVPQLLEPIDTELLESLKQCLFELLGKEFGVTPFFPDLLQRYPTSWIIVDPEKETLDGRVRLVRCPGLKDKDETLRCRAIVELE